MKILVIPNFDKKHALTCTKQVCGILHELGLDILMAAETQQHLVLSTACYDSFDVQLEQADLILAIGGDGTIIHSAKSAVRFGIPVLGINAGRLGFLAGLERNELHKLSRLVDGTYTVESRMMLDVVHRTPSGERCYLAFNDVVVSKGPVSRMIEVDVTCNERLVSSYRADGLIFSTPTGSTAYAVSAGGPIIEPSLNSISMTPISPQSLFSRSILFAPGSELCLKLRSEPSIEAYITVDGERAVQITEDDILLVRQSATQGKLINVNDKAFYEVLNEKFITRAKE